MRLDVVQLKVRVFAVDGLIASHVLVVSVDFRLGQNADPGRNATWLIQLDHGRRYIKAANAPNLVCQMTVAVLPMRCRSPHRKHRTDSSLERT
jgi:hypothetical protein